MKEPSVKDRNFWQEFDSAARWLAKRGYRGEIGEPLPEFISARLARYINEYPEGFANRFSDFLKVPRPRNPGRKKSRRSVPRLDTDNTWLDVWEERDRLWIALHDRDTDDILYEWWDEDAAAMFEDGFFEARDLHGSVLRYLWSVGAARR